MVCMRVVNVILLMVLVLLQYRLWNGNSSLPDLWDLEEIRAEQTVENKFLRERNQALAAEVMDLKTGMEAIEERARSEMGMTKSSETFFHIITEP